MRGTLTLGQFVIFLEAPANWPWHEHEPKTKCLKQQKGLKRPCFKHNSSLSCGARLKGIFVLIYAHFSHILSSSWCPARYITPFGPCRLNETYRFFRRFLVDIFVEHVPNSTFSSKFPKRKRGPAKAKQNAPRAKAILAIELRPQLLMITPGTFGADGFGHSQIFSGLWDRSWCETTRMDKKWWE